MTSTRKRIARSAAAALAALALAAAVGLPAQASPTATEAGFASWHRPSAGAKPTVVLVHGAWADASSFAPVTVRLQAHGYKVINAPNQLRSLKNDTAQVEAFLHDNTTGPVVLVGHSYGGAVITDAALSDPDVKALVYIDAYAPDEGETVQQLTNERPGSLLNAPLDSVFNLVQSPTLPEGDPDAYIKPEKFPAIFAAGLPSWKANQLAVSQESIALGALQEPSTAPAWKTIPSWYVIGTADKVLPAAEQRFMAARANSHVTDVNAPHLSMLARPYQVEQTIIAAAKSVK